MHNLLSVLENETHKHLWDFWQKTDHLISTRRLDLIIINIKKKTCRFLDFAAPADRRVKLKESEKNKNRISTSTFQGNWKKLWNIKVTIISIVIYALGTVTKGLIETLEDLEEMGKVAIIQTTALLKSVRILRIVRKTFGELLSLILQ